MCEERPIRGMTFDLDGGTLLTILPGLTIALDWMVTEHGLYPPALVRIFTWIGNDTDVLMEGPPLLTSVGIEYYFALIIGGNKVSAPKLHPAPLYLVFSHLGLCARELLFIGDSRNDILSAKAAGCLSAGIIYGYNYGEAITLSYPDYLLDCFADLFLVLGLLFFLNQDVENE